MLDDNESENKDNIDKMEIEKELAGEEEEPAVEIKPVEEEEGEGGM